VIGTQNPDEFVATNDLSEALKDRFEYLGLKSLSQVEMLLVLEEKIGKIKKETKGFVESFLNFSLSNKKVRNSHSLRIVIALARVYETLGNHFSDEEKAMYCADISLKNRLMFIEGYTFEQFLEDWLKKKVR
jgi:MoxR-like ATPase